MLNTKLSVQVLRNEKDNVVKAIEDIWGLWLGEMVVCRPEYPEAPCQWVHLDDATEEYRNQLAKVSGVQVMYW